MAAKGEDQAGQPEQDDDASDSSTGQSEGKPLHSGNSVLVTAGIIVADVVGAGILSMANAVACFGWLLGTFMLLLLLAMNVHVSLLLWRVCMQFPEARTYTDLVRAAFATAPKAQKRAMSWLTASSQYLFMFAVLSLYLLSVGKGLGMIFYDSRFCLTLWSTIGCMLILPFNLTARSMGTWKCLIWLNCGTILGSVILPLVYMAGSGVDATRPPGSRFEAVSTQMSFDSTLSGLSTFTFAFTSQFMLVEIISEMKQPADMPKAYAVISAPFQVTAFLIVGLGGYYYVGDKVGGMIADNIAFSRMFRAAAVCLVVHMLIVYQVKGTVLCRALHSAFHPTSLDEDTPMAWGIWVIMVLVIMSAVWVCGQVVPFFADLVDLLGASLTPVSCYFIPLVTYLRAMVIAPAQQADESGSESESESNSSIKATVKAARKPPGPLEWILITAEMLLTIGLTIFGTRAAALHIAKNWGTYGYPFACHCEGLWNTCECSGQHAGMESCRTNGTSEL